jgi:cold-inducible RNA-binding protein
MGQRLFIGGLSFSTSSDRLREVFAAIGSVTQATVVTDQATGRSRGFGFVEMADGGDEAIAALNGAQVEGRALTVNEAKPREDRPRTGAGTGGNGRRDRF